jgi:hypothetical protein
MSDDRKVEIVTFVDSAEKPRRRQLVQLLRDCPIPEDELMLNLGLFLTPQTLSRVLFMDFLYRKIVPVQGIIIEFGCRWGQSLALFSAFRGIYEPFNRLRKIVGFDTFEGLVGTSIKDGSQMKTGAYSVAPGYEEYLRRLMELQEQESPLPHLRKFEIVKGDAAAEIHAYLDRHPETVVAMAYFDMDIYEPTRECLAAVKDCLTRGSVIGFDEANEPAAPGETLALKEVLGLRNISLKRFPFNSRTSYAVLD